MQTNRPHLPPQRLPLRTPPRSKSAATVDELKATILEMEEEILELKRIVLPELVFPERWGLTNTEAKLLTFFFTAPTGFRSYESLDAFIAQRALKAEIENRQGVHARCHSIKKKMQDYGISLHARS